MLKMNFEQDSTGKPGEWVAYFTDTQGSVYAGRAVTPELAILDLAGKVRQEQNRKSFSSRVTNALTQPLTNTPSILGGSVDETLADIAKVNNVGKIVHYTPGSDDADQGGVLPAIITKEWAGGRMDLQVFNNKVSGTSSRYSVEFSPSRTGGTWDWPKKG